jgi:hypothetical protein
MDLVDKIITFWAGMAALWLILLGPLCVFLGAKIVRRDGLSFLRAAAINALFSVGTGAVGLLAGLLLDGVGAGPIVNLVIDTVLAFAVGVLFFKLLAKASFATALKGFGAGFALMLVIEGAFLVAFSMEQDLRPEVVAALETEEDPDPENNMFYALMGFSVAPDQDPHRAGRELVDEFNLYLEDQGGAIAPEPFEEPKPVELERYDELDELFEKEPRLDELTEEDQRLITEVYKANKAIVDAYRDLRRYESFHNTITPHMVAPLPQYITLMRANRLILAKARVDFLAGDAAAAIEALRGEIRFARFLLAESETLISKMISVALAKRCYGLYAELLDDGAFVASGPLLDDELMNLEQSEWGLGEAMRWEFRAAAAVMSEVGEMGFAMAGDAASTVPELGFGLIWKENDAINMLHPWYDGMARDFELPAHEYAKLEIPEPEIEPTWGEAIFNPIAVILMQIAVPAFERYYHRMFALDGLIRLVRLKQEIRVQKIGPDAIAGFAAGRGDDLRNPYTLEPMVWDAEEKILWFERAPDDDDCRDEVEIGEIKSLQPEPEPEAQGSNGSTETPLM